MTRGQIAIIQEDGIMTSTEFNGDMYMPNRQWAGHGRKVINALKRVNDVADYQFEVAKFNKENHHYNDRELTYWVQGHERLDFTQDYFEHWFSDYVYIKNLTKKLGSKSGLIPEYLQNSDSVFNPVNSTEKSVHRLQGHDNNSLLQIYP